MEFAIVVKGPGGGGGVDENRLRLWYIEARRIRYGGRSSVLEIQEKR